MAKKSYNASYESIFGGKNKASKVEKKKKKSSRKKDSVVADLLCGKGGKKKKKKNKKGLEKELRKAMKRRVSKEIGVSVDPTDPDSIREVFCTAGPGVYYITGVYEEETVRIAVACPIEFINVLAFGYEIPETEIVGYDMNSGEMVSVANIQKIKNIYIASAWSIDIASAECCSGLFECENSDSPNGPVVIGLQAVSDDGVEVLDNSKEEGDKE